MKFKSLLLPTLLASHVMWLGCTNNVETPTIDCSLSDLSIAVVSQEGASCATLGSITVSASGGSDSYEFSLDGVNFQAGTTLDGLSAGDYTVVVRDSDGCTDSDEVTLEGEGGTVSLSLDSTDTSCGEDEGSVTATATGGTPPYSFSLNGGAAQGSGSFTNLPNGENTVTVADDNGCEAERSVVITTGVGLAADVMPIISSNCAVTGCHNGSRSPNLSTGSAIIAAASRIKARTTAGTMPPAGRPDLTANEIEMIACWVDDGAPNN